MQLLFLFKASSFPKFLSFAVSQERKKPYELYSVYLGQTTQHFYKLNLNYEENGIAARNAGMNCITGPLCYDIIGIINHTTIYKTGCVCMNYEEKAYCLMMENWHRQ